jgi:hypothetical protein
MRFTLFDPFALINSKLDTKSFAAIGRHKFIKCFHNACVMYVKLYKCLRNAIYQDSCMFCVYMCVCILWIIDMLYGYGQIKGIIEALI